MRSLAAAAIGVLGAVAPATSQTVNVTQIDLSALSTYSVKSFGSKGDGTSDDTAAIQAAINAAAAGGGVVFLPTGNYRISAPLQLPINTIVSGANTATDATKGTNLLFASTVPGAACLEGLVGAINAEGHAKIVVRDLQISLSSDTTYGIHLRGASDVVVDRVHIQGHATGTNRGIYCEDCISSQFTRNHIRNVQWGIVSDQLFNNNLIAANNFENIGQYAILLRGNVGGLPGGVQVQITGNNFIKTGPATFQGALRVVPPFQGLVFENNTVEVMQSVAVLIDRSDPVSGQGAGFVDGFRSHGNVYVAGVSYNVALDHTRYGTLGPDVNVSPAGPQQAFYFIGRSSSRNVIQAGTQTAGKPLVLETAIMDTTVSSEQYAGVPRVLADPDTTGWKDKNHAGRFWWDVTGARGRVWNGVTVLSWYGRARVTPAFGRTVAIDAAAGDWFFVSATDASAFSIANPANPTAQGTITITIRNASGGALGPVAWGSAYKIGPWAPPANGKSRSVTFAYDGTQWLEISRTAVDVPN
jgi:hypothetical protein